MRRPDAPPARFTARLPTVVITPTFNERANVAELVTRFFAAVDNVALLVVDDSSPDGTADLCERLRRVHEVSHQSTERLASCWAVYASAEASVCVAVLAPKLTSTISLPSRLLPARSYQAVYSTPASSDSGMESTPALPVLPSRSLGAAR